MKVMKGIVLKALDNEVLVMTEKGQFVKIKKPNHSTRIGMEITINQSLGLTLGKFTAAAAMIITPIWQLVLMIWNSSMERIKRR